MTAVAAVQANIRQPFHRQSAQNALHQRLSALLTQRRPCHTLTRRAFRNEFHALIRLMADAQVFQHFCPRYKLVPAKQHFGIDPPVTVVCITIGVVQQGPFVKYTHKKRMKMIKFALHKYRCIKIVLIQIQCGHDTTIVQRVRPGAASIVLPLIDKVPRLAGMRVYWLDRVIWWTTRLKGIFWGGKLLELRSFKILLVVHCFSLSPIIIIRKPKFTIFILNKWLFSRFTAYSKKKN